MTQKYGEQILVSYGCKAKGKVVPVLIKHYTMKVGGGVEI